tara:strand:- start:98 stop:580 length:483 start_codon:yes stop_codon:yes gene_type:complete
MVKCKSGDNSVACRSFQVFGSGIGYKSPSNSYYKGKAPTVVAKKFGSMLFRLINDKTSEYFRFQNQSTIKFIMKETTRGSEKSTFYYRAERVELPEPIRRTLPNGNVIVNKYRIVIHKCGGDDLDLKEEDPLDNELNKSNGAVSSKRVIVENIEPFRIKN